VTDQLAAGPVQGRPPQENHRGAVAPRTPPLYGVVVDSVKVSVFA
jgi:hypothetical protein